MVSLKQEEPTAADACCSISFAAPESAPSLPSSSGGEPAQSYSFKSRKGYSLQVAFIDSQRPFQAWRCIRQPWQISPEFLCLSSFLFAGGSSEWHASMQSSVVITDMCSLSCWV